MKVTNLTKTYGDTTVLNIDSFEFHEGKIYAIVGANGSGKSTLLKIISNTIKPNKNSVVNFDGISYSYMPQKNYAFRMSTLSNVLLTSKNKSKDKARAMELLSKLKIDHLAKRQASKLSGGETARMALARIMLNEPDLLLLDEPCAAMDIESTILSEDLIRKEHKTVILVTHSISQAKRIADEVIFMKDGKIIESGPVDKVLDNPTEEETRTFLEFFSFDV